MLPIAALSKDVIIIKGVINWWIINRDSGISFWIVDNNRHEDHEIDDITDGNQKCSGTIPNLIIKPLVNRVGVIYDIGDVYHIENLYMRSKFDPSAWARKYLIDASNCWDVCIIIIIGMKHNIFISNSSHIYSQFLLIIDSVILSNRIL